MFLARWNGACPRTSWVRGRLARTQRCAPSRERGHLALDCPTSARRARFEATGADGERTDAPHHGNAGISPSAALRARDALALRQPARMVNEQCAPSRERGHLALGCPTSAGRARSEATSADGERTDAPHHGSAGILPSTAPRARDALAPQQPARMVNEHRRTVQRVLPISCCTVSPLHPMQWHG